jgi:hypothetical protein
MRQGCGGRAAWLDQWCSWCSGRRRTGGIWLATTATATAAAAATATATAALTPAVVSTAAGATAACTAALSTAPTGSTAVSTTTVTAPSAMSAPNPAVCRPPFHARPSTWQALTSSRTATQTRHTLACPGLLAGSRGHAGTTPMAPCWLCGVPSRYHACNAPTPSTVPTTSATPATSVITTGVCRGADSLLNGHHHLLEEGPQRTQCPGVSWLVQQRPVRAPAVWFCAPTFPRTSRKRSAHGQIEPQLALVQCAAFLH